MLLADDNINIPNTNNWATEFDYTNPQVEQSVQPHQAPVRTTATRRS